VLKEADEPEGDKMGKRWFRDEPAVGIFKEHDLASGATAVVTGRPERGGPTTRPGTSRHPGGPQRSI